MHTGVELLDPLDALTERVRSDVLRIGLAVPLSGLLGMTGPSAMEAAIFAAAEVNAQHGVDRRIEFVVLNSGRSPERVAADVAQLTGAGAVQAFVGLHTSHTLEHVEHAISGKIPYFFASGFEGTRSIEGVFCPGETPVQFVPGLQRLIQQTDARRWAIIGTDYVWPREARQIQTAAIRRAHSAVVLDQLIPENVDRASISEAVSALAASSADGVILNMAGRDLAIMLKAISHRGLDQLVRVAGGVLEENVLYAIGGDRTGRLYTSMHSFESVESGRRIELNARYRRAFGSTAPALNSWAEHCYDGVHLIARCAESDRLTVPYFSNLNASNDPEWLAYEQHLVVADGLRFTEI